MTNHYTLQDTELENQFKNASIDRDLFNHEAHLRLAWIYIQRYGIDTAISNMCVQTRNFARTAGAPDKFNMTVTVAAVKAVYHFIQRSQTKDFREFIETFPRLNNNFKDLLKCHYSIDIFNSQQAKKQYIPPDIAPFE